ncbi:hypothetical protein AJ79_08212 [Helicocarpus griseus UAMH5409]|uniref:Uncharacterized protein n=1 Tax=Helicocarpus griseus UAMH5409 TaxID=1447875 RepID=A0A2B7WV27_9EURO|nr:hypothetical protein AJ79_08212 [Helicocarpus griseus UAMH5409]
MPPTRTVRRPINEPISAITDESLKVYVDSLTELTDCIRFLRLAEVQQRIHRLKDEAAPELDKEDNIQKLEEALATISAVKDKEIKRLEDEVIGKLAEENKKLKEEARAVEVDKENIRSEKIELDKSQKEGEKKLDEMKKKIEDEGKKYLEREENKLKKKYQDEAETERKNLQERIQDLEKEKTTVDESNKKMKRKLERLDRDRRSLEDENEELRSKLATLNPKMAVSTMSPDEYTGRIKHLHLLMQRFAARFFENVPDEVDLVFGPLGKNNELGEASGIFKYASSGDTPVAISLRKAAVQNLICGQLLPLFESKLLVATSTGGNTDRQDEVILNMISSTLKPDDEKVWRGMTVKALDKLPQFCNKTRVIEQMTQGIVEKLQPLWGANGLEIREKVSEIVEKALEIWSLRRKDSCKITINSKPGPKNDRTWEEWPAVEDPSSVLLDFEFPGNGINGHGHGNSNRNGSVNGPDSPTNFAIPLSPTTPALPKHESFVIFPQITGEFETISNDNSNDATPYNSRKPNVLHPGIALFSDSRMFEMGLRDIRSLQDHVLSHKRGMSSISSPTALTMATGSVQRETPMHG